MNNEKANDMAHDFKGAFDNTKKIIRILRANRIDVSTEFFEILPMVLAYIESECDDKDFEKSMEIFVSTVKFYRNIAKSIEKDRGIKFREITNIISKEKRIDGYW